MKFVGTGTVTRYVPLVSPVKTTLGEPPKVFGDWPSTVTVELLGSALA
jgi:hypothetical protein